MKKLLSQKPWFLLALLVLALGAGNCKKLLYQLNFQVNDSVSFAVPAAAPGAPLPLPGATVTTTAATTYAANGTTADFVQDVSVDQLTLTVTDPATPNFDFLKRVEVYIADPAGTTKILIASLGTVPAGQTTLRLTPTANKFDVFLRGKPYALFVTLELAQPLPQPTTLRADVRYAVLANRAN